MVKANFIQTIAAEGREMLQFGTGKGVVGEIALAEA